MSDENFCHNCFEPLTDDRCEKCGHINKNDKYNELACAAGTILKGRYKLGMVVGSGGFGITYKAKDIESGKIVAVKEYAPSMVCFRDFDTNCLGLKMSKHKNTFESGLKAFISEANFLSFFKTSPYIVNIYDCFNENDTAYYSMEFLDGYALKEITGSDLNLAYMAMLKTAEGLRAVHNKGIVHRDISPQNIFLLKNSEIKLIDFGNARYFNKNNENDDELILKPGFSPPELYMKENVQGPWTDIYSLAATFYAVVTGIKLPSAIERINGVEFTPLRKLAPRIEYGTEAAINKALELDYYKRYKTVDEFLSDLRSKAFSNYANTVPLSTPPGSFAQPKPAPAPIQAVPNSPSPPPVVPRQNTAAAPPPIVPRQSAPPPPIVPRSTSAYTPFTSSAGNISRQPSSKKTESGFSKLKKKLQEGMGARKESHYSELERDEGRPFINRLPAENSFSRPAAPQQTYTGSNVIFNSRPAPAQKQPRGYVLSYDGSLYQVSDMRSLVIGRVSSSCHIVINDDSVSRKHCVIEFSAARKEFYITDWSSNGVFFADKSRLKYGVKYAVKSEQDFYLVIPKYNFKVVIQWN
ncbi:MAG: protein kinase [Clostridiales bacterium]|nr:protein kinase [Clostridiales bacterium]